MVVWIRPSQIWVLLWDPLGDLLDHHIWDSLRDQIWVLLWDPLWDPLDNQIWGRLWAQVGTVLLRSSHRLSIGLDSGVQVLCPEGPPGLSEALLSSSAV